MEQLLFKANNDVILHLVGKAYKPYRCIGKISNDVFYTTRNTSQNHTYRHHNSIGFCYRLICDHSDKFSLISVAVNGMQLWTSIRACFRHGKITNFKKNDLELQIHLPVEKFHYTEQAALNEKDELQAVIDKELALINHTGKNKSVREVELSLFDL